MQFVAINSPWRVRRGNENLRTETTTVERKRKPPLWAKGAKALPAKEASKDPNETKTRQKHHASLNLNLAVGTLSSQFTYIAKQTLLSHA